VIKKYLKLKSGLNRGWLYWDFFIYLKGCFSKGL
jgi:hypothetical protein